MKIIDAAEFRKKQRPGISGEILQRAESIVDDVGQRGLIAVLDYTSQFDKIKLDRDTLVVATTGAAELLTSQQRKAIDTAFERVNLVQEAIAKDALRSTTVNLDGGYVEFRPRSVSRVGIYVPGGRSSLPSSLLMAGVTAKAAGVKEIVVCTPPQKDGIAPTIKYIAEKLGIKTIYSIGGAQAIAAMAYGLDGFFDKVAIICGPGNAYVAAAKQIVSAKGLVGIDLPAGPSEVIIIADETANPKFVAADLLAQAEHGTNSPAILLTNSGEVAQSVLKEIKSQLMLLSDRDIIEKSLASCGAVVLVSSIDEAVVLSNEYGPEHVEIFTRETETVAEKITAAGAVFIETGEAFADYGMTGGNHILPTGGAASFSSGLSPYNFLVRTYVESIPLGEQKKLAGLTGIFADLEGLPAHAAAARIRSESEVPTNE